MNLFNTLNQLFKNASHFHEVPCKAPFLGYFPGQKQCSCLLMVQIFPSQRSEKTETFPKFMSAQVISQRLQHPLRVQDTEGPNLNKANRRLTSGFSPGQKVTASRFCQLFRGETSVTSTEIILLSSDSSTLGQRLNE